MSRGKTGIGIDVRAKSIIIATLKRDGRHTTLTDLQSIDTPQLLERGGYRDTHHVIEAVNRAIEAHITTNPRIALSAIRSRTLMTTVPLKGLTRQKATQVITAQATRHFPNPNELALTVDTAHLTARGRKPKTTTWLAAATPNEHLKALTEIEEGISRTIARYEPKATATLRAAHPHVTEPGDHIVLGGGDDGADLTLILNGAIELVRLVGTDLERDITPELVRTLDYLRSEGREAPTLHLAAYQGHAQHLADTLEVDVTTVTPWDALTVDPELEQETALLDAAVTAIGLALGALDDPTPDLNLRPAARRARPTQAGGGTAPRTNIAQAASLLLVLGAGAYHLMTTLAVNDLRASVQSLQAQLTSTTSPERLRVEELQTTIDELLRHEALAAQLTSRRLRPTEHIQRVVSNLPSTSRSRHGDGLRFQTLSLRVATEAPPAHQPLPLDAQPATLITITGVAPNNLTLENDLRALEADASLRTHVRHANRVNPDDPTDASIATQIEVLTLHQPAGRAPRRSRQRHSAPPGGTPVNPRTLPLLALLVIAAGYTSLHRPLQAEKATLERQRANLTEQARVDQHATALLVADLEAQLAGLEPRRASIEAALPRDLNPSDTLALIREAASRNHVTVNTTSIEDPQQDGDLKTIAIALAVDGTYDELLSFARDLENHTWPLTVNAINLETNQRGADPRLDARVSLQLHAYNPMPLDHFVTSEWDY